ncbi:class I SAM-dependent methyltransferase [Azospirillum sp.]|uniref:class I SAM-dependent methyltransferase n=1 Tax=Azospirillum sp. TaxID=34012 RepID=UPI003D73B6EE
MTAPRHSNHKAMLAEVLDPRGKAVADVGCGDGAMVRHLTREGATAVGLEPSPEQLARARAAEPAGGETYREGRGEALPFEDGSLDAVLYFNSFHHLPLDAMPPALAEAARVLRPAGLVIAVEPLAEGAYFAVLKPVEDETAVRAAAYEALREPPAGLVPELETVYLNTVKFRDFAQFIDSVVAADRSRRERLPAVEAEMRRLFEAGARIEDGKTAFDQPMRMMVLRKPA